MKVTRLAHLARFGSASGAHGLLAHTLDDESAAESVLWYTDLPRQGDSAAFEPFFAGFPAGDQYVVQRTESDPTADRAGMVSTTAIFFPADAAVAVDLALVFDQLQHQPSELLPLDLGLISATEEPFEPPPGTADLASALMRSGVAVWLGGGAEVALRWIWLALSGLDRLRLRFGTAFHPEDISLPPADLTVAITPARYARRWEEWPRVDPATSDDDDPAANALLRQGTARPILDLADELAAGTIELRHWPLLSAAADIRARLDHATHEEARALTQILGRLAPTPATGARPKAEAVAALERLAATASADDIRGLRSLPDAALGGTSMHTLLAPWASTLVANTGTSAPLIDALGLREDQIQGSDIANALTAAVQGDRAQALLHAPRLAASSNGEASLEWLTNELGAEAIDGALAFGLPNKPAPWLERFVRRSKLARTYAQLVDVTDAVVAWRALLAMPTSCPEAEELLVARTGSAGVVDAAVAIEGGSLARRAARAVAGDPQLLKDADPQAVGLPRLLAAVVEQGVDPWAVVPAEAVGPVLLDRLVAGEDIDATLLESLADTPAADVSAHANRAEIWLRLPRTARDKMLAATAVTVAAGLSGNRGRPEPELCEAILAEPTYGALAHDDPSQALIALQLLPGAGPSHAAQLARRGRFTQVLAKRFGELIVRRRWKSAATTVAKLAVDRKDLQPAAHAVIKLFNILDRLALFRESFGPRTELASDAELRDALHEMVIDLYPRGPEDNDIWERAGGLVGDIPRARSAREAWSKSLRLILAGGRGAPELDELFGAMVEDHPRNGAIQSLRAALRREHR